MGSSEKSLIFCDTFSHEGEEGQLHVDMVKFSPPVTVKEVRVIPKNSKVHATVSDTIGQTQPSSFTLDIYINNSQDPLAPTFDPLGIIEYDPDKISLESSPKNPSDQLVVRGLYTTLTLCVYGTVVMPPQAPPLSPQHGSASPYSNAENFSDGEKERREAQGNAEEGDAKGFELYETFSPVNSPDHLFDLSDEEILPTKRSTAASGGYEELSDEEVNFDGDFDAQEGADSYYGEEGWLTSGVGFDPYQCELTQLEWYQLVTDTPHEVLLAKLQRSEPGGKRGGTDEASKLRDLILKQRDLNQPQKWVEMIEEIPSYLYPGLAQLHKKSSADAKEVMQKLVNWTLQCLDLEQACQLPLPLSVRHLKAGLRLVPSIAGLGRKCTNALVKHSVMERLCQLLSTGTMASSLKLMALRALDSLLNYPQGLERFLGWDKEDLDSSPYQKVLDLQLSIPSPRVSTSVSALLCKARIGEQLGVLQQSVERVIAVTPLKPPDDAPPPADLYDLYHAGGAGQDEGEGMTVPGQPLDPIEEVPPQDQEQGMVEGAEGERMDPPEEKMDSQDDMEEPAVDEGGLKEEEREEPLEGEGPQRMEEGEGEREGQGIEGEGQEAESMAVQLDEEEKDAPSSSLFPEEEARKVIQCLQSLKELLERAKHSTVQPPMKAFPTSSPCFPESGEEFFPPLVRAMRSRRLLPCLLVLLAAPSTCMYPGLFEAVKDLLLLLLSTQDGTIFLCSCPEVMNAMVRVLVPAGLEEMTQMEEDDMLPLVDLLDSSEGENSDPEPCSAQNLGLLLIYHLQVLQSLDMLRKASKLNMSELESSECIGALHTLYTMTLTPIGKYAVPYLLSLSDNVLTLLPFIEPRQQRDHDLKLTKSSVSSRYAAVLLLALLKSSVRFDFLFSCGAKLLSAAEFFKDNSSPLMSDLNNWFSPVKELTPGDSAKVIPALVGLIKEKTSSISCSKPGRACSPIMTAIRMLLCYITPDPSAAKSGKKDPKLTLSLIHLFSCNCLDTLLTFLGKFCDTLLPVWSQRQSLSVSNASVLVSLATCVLQLLKRLLGSLLSSDGEEFQFRDTRVAEVLLRVHMVLCSAPYFTVAINAAHEIRMLIVDILVVYTKPRDVIEEGKDTPDISQNCWCLMLKEVFQHTLSSPHCFLSGLMILSELLPLPLPVHSPSPLSAAHVVYQRKLWALHLDPFLSDVGEVVRTFLLSSASALQQMLRRVCAQLADISAPLALLITQQLISSILVEIEKQLEKEEPEPPSEEADESKEGEEEGGTKEEKGAGPEDQEAEKMVDDDVIKKSPNSPLLRTLTTCAVLCQQNAIKVALLNLITQKETDETKGFSRFIPLLLFLVQRKETMVQHKLCIMTILNAMCNMYVALTTSESEDQPPSEQQLSNCLPGKMKLETITSAVLGHVTSPDQPLATMMLGLKIILSLCQYDVGLLNIYRHIPTHIKGFAYVLQRLTEAVSSSSPPPDTISCVSLFLQLLGHLLSSVVTGRAELFDEGELQPSPRSSQEESSSEGSEKKRDSHYEVQSVGFPRPLLKMIICGENGESLLANLRDALELNCKEDTSLFTEFTKIIATLEQEFEGVEPSLVTLAPLEYRVWPAMQSVESQFELRNVISLSINPPAPDYWMPSPPHDEGELDPDTVVWDLNKLATQTCPGLNLEEELKKHLLPSPPRTPPRADRKRKIALTGPEAQKKLKEAIQQRMLHGPKRDLFRLRKQNTSRPPSMHVDDFMAAKSGSKSGRGMSHEHGLSSRMPGGGRGGYSYVPQAGMFMPTMQGGRWMGAGGMPPAGMGYPRRDMVGGALRTASWDSRIPSAFLSSQLKSSALSRNVSMYSALQAYSRASGSSGRGPIMWPGTGGRSSSSSLSGRQGESGSGHKSTSSSSGSRHSIYKRLV